MLLGLSKEEIAQHSIKLPSKDYVPGSIEAEILCYADRFHRKKPAFLRTESYLTFLREKGFDEQIKRMNRLVETYGIPDLEQLAKTYRHPIS